MSQIALPSRPAAQAESLFSAFVIWRSRRRTRRALARLDAHLLADIGMSKEDMQQEALKPFWLA